MSLDTPEPQADRYRSEGEGLALDTRLGRQVVIRSASGAAGANLQAEAALLARLNHPGADLVLDVVQSGDRVDLILRKGRGSTLADLVASGDPVIATPTGVVQIVGRAAEVLAAAHDIGLVHHRLKLSAIRVESGGHVTVEGWQTGLSRSLQTVSAKLVSTKPTVREGRPDGLHQDLRDLGACLLSVLIRREVTAQGDAFAGLSPEEAARVPAPLAVICRKAMGSDATTGYTGMAEFVADLRGVLATPLEGASTLAPSGSRGGLQGLLALVAVVAIFIALAQWYVPRQPPGEDWGKPILHEDFADSSWKQRWRSPYAGGLRFVTKDGRLESTGERNANLIFRRRLTTPIRVEYTGEIPIGSLPCDLSLGWNESPGYGEGSERPGSALIGRSSNFQFGGHDNSRCIITDTGHPLPVAYTDEVLPVGRPILLRVEIEAHDVRMFVDNREILHYESIRPYLSGYVSLYAHYPGKRFDDVRIWQKPAPPMSPLTIADALFAKDTYEWAAEQYQIVAEAHAGEPLAELALYRKGLCFWKLKDRTRAKEQWALIKDPALQDRVACYNIPEDPSLWRFKGFFAEFAKNYKERPLMREGLREIWATALEEVLTGTDHDLFDRFLALRDELFPEDGAARFMAAEILARQGRFEECLERFPTLVGHAAYAMTALGRADEVLAADWAPRDYKVKAWQMKGDYAAMAKTEAVIPEIKALALCKLGQAEGLADDPDLRYPVLLHLGRANHLLASRPLSARTANEALIALGRYEEAAHEGLEDVPDSGNGFHAKLLLGDIDGAEAIRGSLPGYRFLQAAESGDDESLVDLNAKVVLPKDLRAHAGWFMPVIVKSLVWHWRGETDALEHGIRPYIATLDQTFGRRGAFLGRIILGDVPVAELKDLTAVTEREAWTLLATAIRAELDEDPAAARAAYQAFVELPIHLRLLALNIPDPEVELFVGWRLRVLKAP